MSNLSIKQKLYSLTLGILITVMLMLSFTVYKLSDIEKEYNYMDSKASAGKVYTLEINKDVNYLSRLTRDIMLNNDYASNMSKINDTVLSIKNSFSSLEEITIDAEGKNILSEAKNETMKFVNYSKSLMDNLQNTSRDTQTLQNTYEEYKKNGSPLAKEARKSFNKLIDIKSQELETISKQVHNSISTIKVWLPVLVILNIIMLIAIFLGIKSFVSNIKKVQNGLFDFFNFLNGTKKHATSLKVKTNDEIGKMAHAINENVAIIEAGLEKDAKVLEEANIIVDKAINGFYTYKIKAQAHNPQLEDLKNKINNMNDNTNKNLSDIVESLISFGNANYTRQSKLKASGNIGSLVRGTNAVGASVSEVISTIANTSDQVSNSATSLANISEKLSTSANQQASSLEETAAAIEQITSTIRNTVDKSNKMGEITKELKSTSLEGNKLASNTATAMDEINHSTSEIEDAITIIDQIAFQTNILSLNAAVEAATAGEAGKGFAVVAGEVRNLAARSAEAASDIKAIVDKARQKAIEGKSIADKMMSGYAELSDKVELTSSLVSEVEGASKEQMVGMDQINHAISTLDQATQENAAASSTVSYEATGLNTLTHQLVSVVNKTTYDESRRDTVCDVDLTFETTKLKLDLIDFKDKNFQKVGNGESWEITSQHNSRLGKWLDAHKGESYATTSAWKELLAVHKNVHTSIQSYINIDAHNQADEKLVDIANSIEKDTVKVFSLINDLKRFKCKEVSKTDEPKKVEKKVVEPTKETISTPKSTAEKKPIVAKVDIHDDEWDSF